jgi:hypothetical protein
VANPDEKRRAWRRTGLMMKLDTSDGIAALCAAEGPEVLQSPRIAGPQSGRLYGADVGKAANVKVQERIAEVGGRRRGGMESPVE